MGATNDLQHFVLPDNLTQDWLVPGSIAIAVGDLMYDAGADVAKPADQQASQGSEALDQALFASKFIGTSQEQVLSSETSTTKRIVVRTDGVVEANCPSQTFNKGDLVGVYSTGALAPDPQQVDKVTIPALAIGVVVKYYGSATTRVRFRMLSRRTNDIVSSLLFPGMGAEQGASSTAAADAALVLTVASNPIQTMTPTANRTVTLPAVAKSKGFMFQIVNQASTGFTLTVQNAGATVIALVGPLQTGEFFCDGVSWFGTVGSTTIVSLPPSASKTADYPLVNADHGTAFDNTGAAGAVNFTLPAVASSKGFFAWFFVVVDQAIVITAPAGTLVGPNNAGRTTYTAAGAGNRIGTAVYAYCNGAKWFLQVDVKGLTLGTFA